MRLMKFSKAMLKALHLGQDNFNQYIPEDKYNVSNLAEKDLVVLVNRKLEVSQTCMHTTKIVNNILLCITSIDSQLKEVILPFYSVLVRLYTQPWGLQHKRDMEL